MRRLLPLLAALLLERSALLPPTAPPPEEIVIRAEPVVLDPADPRRRRVGALVFERGWRLTSQSELFGGLSGLAIDDGAFLALGDTGRVTRFSPGSDLNWFALTVPVPAMCGGTPGVGYDLEGLAVGANHIWVSSEWRNGICRLGADAPRGVFRSEMRGWKRNFGAETLIRLRDGRFVVLEEGAPYTLLLFDRDPTDPAAHVRQLRYRPPSGYRPTDGTELPDGRIVILHRRLDLHGFSSKIVLFDALPSRERPVAQGRLLATLGRPLTHDNFEGIAATRVNGRTILWLVSDDNFLALQETLLLAFRLDEGTR